MQIANIVAIILSPLVAVLVSVWLQNRKERRQQQLWILGTLIGSRSDPLTPENIRALNLIDLVFHDKAKVRQLWREYYEMLNNEGLNNPTGWQQRSNKNIELITEIAKVLGYGKAISHLDVSRVYTPAGVWEQFLKNRELQEELLRVLKSTARIEVVPKTAATPKVQKDG